MTNSDKINETLVRVAPELSSKYAKYPMTRKMWLSAKTKTEEITGFIPYPRDSNFSSPTMKEDYVWGAGPLGQGYYHLLTKSSYSALYNRLYNQRVSGAGCCGCAESQEKIDHDEVKLIAYNRSIASRPDDFLAQKEATALARGEAQAAYNVTQDFQLVMMIVT